MDLIEMFRKFCGERDIQEETRESILDLTEDTVHSLVKAPTGRGKSNFMRFLIKSFQENYNEEELNLYLLDFKATEFQNYSEEGIIRKVVCSSKSSDTLYFLENLCDIVHARLKLFRRAGVRNLKEYNVGVDIKLPICFVILEDLLNLERADSTSGKIERALLIILKLGRGVGVRVIASCHENNNPELRDIFSTIVHVNTDQASIKTVGADNPVMLKVPLVV